MQALQSLQLSTKITQYCKSLPWPRKIDVNRNTFDRRLMANFSKESKSSARDTNLIASDMDYVETIQKKFTMFKV